MSGLYSPSAGDVLTAANAIDYWSKQVVIICTSGTRPASPRSGMTIWQTDTLTYAVYGTAWCETTPYSATVATSESTASTSFADLATSGPAVTIATGTKVLIWLSALGSNTGAQDDRHAVAISGATTLAAAAANGTVFADDGSGRARAMGSVVSLTGLTAGSNVITSKYATSGNTVTFSNRRLAAQGIPT